jgi:hypothetical protein
MVRDPKIRTRSRENQGAWTHEKGRGWKNCLWIRATEKITRIREIKSCIRGNETRANKTETIGTRESRNCQTRSSQSQIIRRGTWEEEEVLFGIAKANWGWTTQALSEDHWVGDAPSLKACPRRGETETVRDGETPARSSIDD